MHVFAPQTARTHFGQDIKIDEQAEDSQMDLLWTRSRAIRPRPVQSPESASCYANYVENNLFYC